jgi:hypothetical protein
MRDDGRTTSVTPKWLAESSVSKRQFDRAVLYNALEAGFVAPPHVSRRDVGLDRHLLASAD